MIGGKPRTLGGKPRIARFESLELQESCLKQCICEGKTATMTFQEAGESEPVIVFRNREGVVLQ